MKHIETLYLGCDNTSEVADASNCIIKFDAGSSAAHALIVSRFSHELFKIQGLAQEGIVTTPYKICILIRTGLIGHKYSKANESTVDQTIMWFAKNWLPPSCGVIFSFYEYDDLFGVEIQQPIMTQVIWPLNDKLQSKRDGGYITYQKFPDALLKRYSHKYENAKETGQLNIIDDIEALSPYPVKEIDYSMSEDEIAELLKHSKMHFTYQGATYFMAAIMNVPTVCYGSPTYMSHPSKWWEYGEFHEESVQVTMWGNYNYGARIPTTKIGQYDFKKQSAVQRPQRYLYHSMTPEDLEGIIKGFAMTVNHVEYSVDD